MYPAILVRANIGSLVVAVLAIFASQVLCSRQLLNAQDSLEPLTYNNPGLTVDLGVGLWAWPIPCDVDGDGDYDLIVSCPDKPSNGIWFFENQNGDTAKHKFPIFKPAQKLSSTVHYVMPSYVGGTVRVLSPGFEYNNFTKVGTKERSPLPISANFYKPQWETNKGPRVRHNQWRYVDYNQDGALDLVVGIEDWSEYGWDDAWSEAGQWTKGPLHGFVFVFLNIGTTDEPRYDEPQPIKAAGKLLDVYGCPSPNFSDFDGDGDLDLLCGEFLDGFTYFQNIGTAQAPEYAAGERLLDVSGKPLAMDLQMIVPIAFDWDRDGDLDLIVGDEDGRVALIENSGKFDSNNSPLFSPPVYFQQQADELKSGALATPFAVDWDGDGDQDILSGNTAGYIEYFENLSGPNVAKPRWNRPVRLKADGKIFRVVAGANGSIQGPAEAKWGYTTLSVADWNDDGLLDIVYNSIWGKIEWLENIGTIANPILAAPQPIEVQWGDSIEVPKPAWTWWEPNPNQLVTQWRTTPHAIDWDGDGLTDLVMMDHEGYLAFYRRTRIGERLVLLPPQRIFFEVPSGVSANGAASVVAERANLLRLNASQAGKSGRRKICIVDWDGDGRKDLLTNSTNANFLKQVGAPGEQIIFADLGPLMEQNIQGHSTSPAVVDFDGNNIPDFLGGAEDGRFYFGLNPRAKPGNPSDN